MATSAEEKAAREKRVAVCFVKKANLLINPSSVESREPPEPDIYCVHDESGPMYFELVDFGDTKELLNTKKDVTNKFHRIPNKSSQKIRNKLKKSYDSNGLSVDLLCYFSGGISTDDQIIPTITEILSAYSQEFVFRRVWYFGEKEICQLWPLGEN